MKKLLLTLCVALTCFAVSAQLITSEVRFSRNFAPKVLTPATFNMPTFKALGEHQMYMGNYTSDNYGTDGLGIPSYPETFKMGALLPLSLVQNYEGSDVVAIRFAVAAAVTEAEVFLIPVTKLSPLTVGDAVISEVVKSTKAGWNTVNLGTPYTINTEGVVGFLLGYQYKQKNTTSGGYYTDDCYPISVVEEGTIQTTYTYGKLGSATAKWQDIGLSDYGNLCVQAVVENENFPEYDLHLNTLSSASFGGAETGLKYNLAMTNVGTKTLTDYTVDLLIDGNLVETLNAPIPVTQAGVTYSGTLALQGIASGSHTLTARAMTAAGEEVTGQEVQCTFSSFTTQFPRQKLLVEHFTSQSCTYCPLGINVLDKLDKLRSDVAWVSIHGILNQSVTHNFVTNEGEQIESYLGLKTWPSAAFNRYDFDFDGVLPYSLGYYEQYAQAAAQMISDEMDANTTPSLATIGLKATLDKDTRELNITVDGQATEDFNAIFGTQVALNVYLTEDSLVARQLNQGKWETNAIHNHVLRDVVTKAPSGDAVKWNGDNTYTNTYTVTLDNTWNTDNMHIVAFMARTGAGVNKEVINAELIDMKDVPAPDAADPALYLLGSFNEWSEEQATPLTLGEDGLWTATIDLEAAAEFKLMDEAGNWWGGVDEMQVGYFLITNELLGQEIQLVDGANFKIPETATWNITVNRENMTMIVNKVVAEPDHVYILGEVNGNSWAPYTGVEMETEDNITFTAHVTCDGVTNGYNFFSFTKKLANDSLGLADAWADIAPYRFTAVTDDDFLVTDELFGQEIALDADGVNYNCAIQVPAGEYLITVNLEKRTVVINKIEHTLLGDVDGSGIVDVDDVNAAINLILSYDQYKDKYPGKADLDGNGMIDIDDVNLIINIILDIN